MRLASPVTGRPLDADTPHSLSDGAGERWPVVDGIPYLRVGREVLVADTLAALDRARAEDALVLLLGDQDDWWTGGATDKEELRQLVRERDTLSLRDAMALLRFGPVADYFAYRWSDPTYLTGLALLEAHWNEPASAFELACGIGHYLRELTRRGVACTGADVVFAKCWLAKHWVAPGAAYVVFDAGHAWPTGDARYDLVMCHDAFYFLPDQELVAQRLRALLASCSSAARTPVERSETSAATRLAPLDTAPRSAPEGVLVVSHLHNEGYAGGSKGPAQAHAEWHALFPQASVYDEAVLLNALMASAAPSTRGWSEDDAVEAISVIEGGGQARKIAGGGPMPVPDAPLRRNPLIDDAGTVRWPSELYRDEYGAGCLWATVDASADPARTRRLVDLPERW